MTDDQDEEWTTRLKWMEAQVREHHTDFDSVLARAGIWQALQRRPDGTYVDQTFARLIFLDPNPPEKAYRIGQDVIQGHHAPPMLPDMLGRPTLADAVLVLAAQMREAIQAGYAVTLHVRRPSRLRRTWRTLIGRG